MIRILKKNLRGKTIAVYGASSNIGSKFTQAAAKHGAIVIAFARSVNKIPLYPKRGEADNIVTVHGDITNPKAVRQSLRGRKVYATINFAVDFSKDYAKAKGVNVLGEKNVLDASVKFGVKRHIFISTIAVLMPKPGAYRDTKLEAERMVKVVGNKYNLDWVILRLANVLGSRIWDQPFKIIFPFFKIGVPKVPTDAKKAPFFYATMDTVIEAILSALQARPNQTITIFDGKITIGEYLFVMEKIHKVRKSFLPGRLLVVLAKLLGKYLTVIDGLAIGVDFMAHQPILENETMKDQLKIKNRNFQKWMKRHSLKTLI